MSQRRSVLCWQWQAAMRRLRFDVGDLASAGVRGGQPADMARTGRSPGMNLLDARAHASAAAEIHHEIASLVCQTQVKDSEPAGCLERKLKME